MSKLGGDAMSQATQTLHAGLRLLGAALWLVSFGAFLGPMALSGWIGPSLAFLPWTAVAGPLAVLSLAALRLPFSSPYVTLTVIWLCLLLGSVGAAESDGWLSLVLGLAYIAFPLLITVHGVGSWLRGRPRPPGRTSVAA
jgi:hypothetical protein